MNLREIPEFEIYKWTILEIHDTFYIDILFHLCSALHNIRRRIGVNSETWTKSRMETAWHRTSKIKIKIKRMTICNWIEKDELRQMAVCIDWITGLHAKVSVQKTKFGLCWHLQNLWSPFERIWVFRSPGRWRVVVNATNWDDVLLP